MTNAPAYNRPVYEDQMRGSSRATIKLMCEVRQGTRSWQRVALENLSVCGFRIGALPHASQSLPLSIRIPGMQLLSARICWQAGPMVGCEFVQPLHVAVFDHLVRQARAL